MPLIHKIFDTPHRISQMFGLNPDIYAQFGYKGHNGIDFATPMGTPILAGAIARIGAIEDYGESGWGRSIVLFITDENHKEIYEVRHGHLRTFGNVKVGEIVTPDSVIGFTGNSGFCVSGGRKVTPAERALGKGAHLHFQVRPCDEDFKPTQKQNGYGGAIDPYPLFDEDFIKSCDF